MNDKLLSIKEFEFITSNESYAETGDNAHYLKERYLFEIKRVQMMKGIL